MANPGALAAGTDGERVVVYVGTPGGVFTTEGIANTSRGEFIESISAEYSILGGGGVYRLTSILFSDFTYLPIINH
jgi:hypothetical protein